MADERKRLAFLCESARLYSVQCPQLAAQLMSRVNAALNGRSDHLPLTACLHCSTPLTPHTASQRTISSKALRKKHQIGKFKGQKFLHDTFSSQHRVVIHCKMCGWSFFTRKSHSDLPKLHHTPHSTPLPTPHSTPLHTPHSTPYSRPSSDRHKSSTLKNLLRESSRPKPKDSPKLADFLTKV